MFGDLLEDATRNASTDGEMGFVESINQLYEEFGDDTFISEKQLDVLERLAGW